jgi:hypothetical protein
MERIALHLSFQRLRRCASDADACWTRPPIFRRRHHYAIASASANAETRLVNAHDREPSGMPTLAVGKK